MRTICITRSTHSVWLLIALLLVQACSDGRVASGEENTAATAAWQIVWSEEFDAESLDRTKWSAEESCWGGGNDERQCYTDREENVRVEDGVLKLSARLERHTGPLYPAHYTHLADTQTREQQYTSGKVITHGKGEWLYGRMSARIKMPAGQGAWAAFWMMPADDSYGYWPLSGEIDVVEAVNLGAVCKQCDGGIEHRTTGALHFGDVIPGNTYRYFNDMNSVQESPAENWRTYSVEWAEGVIQWFVDDEIVMRLEGVDWYSSAASALDKHAAPFDQSFYLILNLAVGGKHSESRNAGGVDTSIFPVEMQVDWVRVEQCAGDRETGLGCLSSQEWEGKPLWPDDNNAS